MAYLADEVAVGIRALVAAGRAAAETRYPNRDILPVRSGRLGDIRSYPFLESGPEGLQVNLDPNVRLNTRLGVMAALNVSPGVGPDVPFEPSDPVVAATREASEFVVVVMSPGNSGHSLQDRETMSAPA